MKLRRRALPKNARTGGLDVTVLVFAARFGLQDIGVDLLGTATGRLLSRPIPVTLAVRHQVLTDHSCLEISVITASPTQCPNEHGPANRVTARLTMQSRPFSPGRLSVRREAPGAVKEWQPAVRLAPLPSAHPQAPGPRRGCGIRRRRRAPPHHRLYSA